MRYHHRLLAGCSLALITTAAMSGPLRAEDSSGVQETVTVNAYRAANSIGASTKTDTPVLETPQSVSVITREEMDARGVQNLNEALRYDAGILTESQGGDSRVDDFYIRGFDDGSWGDNLILDGMRLPPGSKWNRTKFDSWDMERVEVLKGPSAVLYGQVSPGGVVNQVSKTPVDNQMQQLRLSIDAYGKYQSAVDVGTSATDDGSVKLRLVGLYSNGPSSIKHTSQEHWFAAPSVKLALGSDTDLTLMAYYQRDDGGADFQMLPYLGTVEKTIYGYIDNHTFLGEPSWNKFDRSEATLSWVLEHRFNAHWSLSQSARYAHVDNDYRTTQANKDTLTNDRILPRRAVAGVGGAETLTADTRLAGQFSTGALEHSVLFGFDEMRSQWDRARQQSTLSATSIAIDVFNPVYHDYDFAPTLKPTLSETGTQNQSGLYAQDQIAYGHWRLLISGRQDWFLNKTTDRLDGTLTKVESSAFTERAGLLYLFDSGLSPYASFANSFEPASYTATDNYNGKAFSPVTGQQFEVGFKYQPKTIDGMITVSAYELKQQHIATTDPDDSHDCGSGAGSCYVETGEMRVRGIELEGRITPVQGFSIIGALTHMDSAITKATDGTQGHDMIRVPQWLSSIWLDYSFGPGWFNGLSLAGGSRYVGRSFGDTANTLDVPSYALWDGALRYDLTKLGLAVAGTRKLQLAINANNIGDKRYVASCTSSTVCYYGSGRMVQISLQLGW